MKISCQLNNSFFRSSLALVAGAALLSGSSAIAQMSPGGGQQAPPSQQTNSGARAGASPMDQANGQDPNNSMLDKAFVRKALEGGMAEVQLGQLAVQKSSNPDVKEFGQKMVDDHTKLGDQMKQVATQMNIKPPDSLSSKDKKTVAKMSALDGDAFDKAYIKDMVKDHKQDEQDFKHEAMSASNPALKDAASQGEQVISQHLQMIEQIAQKNNVASK